MLVKLFMLVKFHDNACGHINKVRRETVKKSYDGRAERAWEIADISSFPKQKLMLFIKIILQCVDISV